MLLSHFSNKVQRKLWQILINGFRKTKIYPFLYRSFWKYKFTTSGKEENLTCYYTARPHPGAGIGHQMANWIAGYWFSKQLGLQFAHLPFPNSNWEKFLAFGEGETDVNTLPNSGYKSRKLPLFNEYNEAEVELNKSIIRSYSGRKIVFIAEQDQFYRDQFGVMNDLRRKFYQSPARENDHLIYTSGCFNIAIHIRRGDITMGQKTLDPNLLQRWQNNTYFIKVLSTVLENIKTKKPVAIYLFSQGTREEFSDFEKFENIHYCIDMNEQNSFLHLVYADLLITSKSSFSYKPALLSKGIKICPADFWHGYPSTPDWILADSEAQLNIAQFSKIND